MNIALECAPCLVRQALEAVTLTVTDPEQRERLLRCLMYDIADAKWEGTPPQLAQQIHRIIRTTVGNADPYRAIKLRMNQLAMDLLPILREEITKQPDPREAVVRVAIAGNLLDSGAKSTVATEEFSQYLQSLWSQPLQGDIHRLFQEAERAHSILYLADNAGEIFFDRLLIEALPTEKITLAVRGAPTLNDALHEDAEAAGLSEIVPIIDNGSDAPGTILEDTSLEFRQWFDRVDLVISKGQGNYETLSETKKHTFFLLAVKCPLIGDHIPAPVGHLVIEERAEE